LLDSQKEEKKEKKKNFPQGDRGVAKGRRGETILTILNKKAVRVRTRLVRLL